MVSRSNTIELTGKRSIISTRCVGRLTMRLLRAVAAKPVAMATATRPCNVTVIGREAHARVFAGPKESPIYG